MVSARGAGEEVRPRELLARRQLLELPSIESDESQAEQHHQEGNGASSCPGFAGQEPGQERDGVEKDAREPLERKAAGSRSTVSRNAVTAVGNQKSLEYMSQATKMVANSSESEAGLGLQLPAVAGRFQRTRAATAATDTH